jgi:hypothetical protein
MRQAFVLGCALLICICIAGDAQPLVAQDNGQIHAGTCRSEKCPCTAEQKDNGMLDTEVGCISSCQNERKSMIDQGSSLASLAAEYKRNHHPTLEKLISKEFQALEMAQNMGPLWQWWLVSLSKPDQAVQRQNGDQRTMVVPPGEYQVAMQPSEYNSQPVVWPQKIQVQVGQQATFKVSSGVRMIGPSGASPDFEFQFLNDKKQIAQTGRQTWST